MKSPAQDIVLIAVALVAILGCGYGLGNRFAPDIEAVDPSPPEVEVPEFTDLTLARLSESLELTADQEFAILSDIKATSKEITQTRKRALFEYHLLIRELHDKIEPKLDPVQQERLAESRASLQKVIELRFPNLLERAESSSGNGQKTREDRP